MPPRPMEAAARRPHEGHRIDRDALFIWLCSPQVVTPDGGVLSWYNPAKTGFPYPEAAAIWLAWAAWRAARGDEVPPRDLSARVARRLILDLEADRGVGKGGRVYVFDTSLAVDGLSLGARALDTSLPGGVALGRVAEWLSGAIEAGRVVCSVADGEPRWSERAGPFQWRAVAALRRASRSIGEPRWAGMADALSAALAGREDYTHAWLYELEGRARLGRDIGEALDELAALSARTGGLPAWRDGKGALRADAMAQAVRLWRREGGGDVEFPTSVTRERRVRSGLVRGGGTPTPTLPLQGGGGRRGGPCDLAVQAALSALASLQDASGAIRYEPGSPDRNSWCSLFADQAAAWVEDGARDEDWI
jgi:hypothetical protein